MVNHIKCYPINRLRIAFFIFLVSIQNAAAEYYPECHNGVAYEASWFKELRRLPNNTKYLYRYGYHYVTYEACQQYCTKSGLSIVTITSLSDYQSISKIMAPDGVCWRRGAVINGNDAKEEGKWFYNSDLGKLSIFNGTTPLKFQAFNFFEPLNAGNAVNTPANFLWLSCQNKTADLHGPSTGPVFNDISKDSGDFNQFCMCEFTPNSKCWKESDETKKNQANLKTIEKLEKLGDSKLRKYVIGKYQKTWKEALKTCKSNKMKLLDLEFANEKEAEDLAKFMQRFLDKNGLMAQVVSFWLSGSFSKLFTDEEVPFEFDWIDEEWRKKGLPYNFFEGKASQITHGNCMSVGAIYWDSTKLTLSSAVCTVPHWFICYKDS